VRESNLVFSSSEFLRVLGDVSAASAVRSLTAGLGEDGAEAIAFFESFRDRQRPIL